MPNVTQASTAARHQRERRQREQQLLDAAVKIFLQSGFTAAKTTDIAREAGFAVGTIYRFFPSKEQLYAHVLLRVAQELVPRFEHDVLQAPTVHSGLQEWVRLRVTHFQSQQLFFDLFTTQPIRPNLDKELMALLEVAYQRYIETGKEFVARAVRSGVLADRDPLHLVLSLEGIISAFMRFWLPSSHRGPIEQTAAIIQELFLSQCGAVTEPVGTKTAERRSARAGREIQVTRRDLARLRDLILVADRMGTRRLQRHLQMLREELERATVVEPEHVSPDVVTMNSRVRLRHMASGELQDVSLVFPAKAETGKDRVSILAPLGTILLGYHAGDLLTVPEGDKTESACYRIEAILYQPEAAGHYHL